MKLFRVVNRLISFKTYLKYLENDLISIAGGSKNLIQQIPHVNIDLHIVNRSITNHMVTP